MNFGSPGSSCSMPCPSVPAMADMTSSCPRASPRRRNEESAASAFLIGKRQMRGVVLGRRRKP